MLVGKSLTGVQYGTSRPWANPYASNLITPLDASINQPVTGLTFKWTKAKENQIQTIQKYQLQISTDSLFASVY